MNNIRIGVCGNVDAGKSTFIGVLCNDLLDDGNGLARSKILKTLHEKTTGRTSCVSFNYLHFEDRSCTLVDLAGHEKYLKTTLYGITGSELHYGIVIIGANMGVSRMTKEHLGILLFLRIPIIIILTKIDMVPEDVYEKTKKDIIKILKSPIFRAIPKLITNNEQFDEYINNIKGVIPIIPVSSKTGQGIDDVKKIIKLLPIENNIDNLTDHPIVTNINNNNEMITNKKNINGVVVYIESTYNVKGIGIVITGYIMGGNIDNNLIVNQSIWIGPVNINASNQFIECKIRSMHNTKRQNINTTYAGDHVIMAIRSDNKFKLEKKHFYKGIVCLSRLDDLNYMVNKFKVQLKILNNKVVIKPNYNPVIHCHTVRQTAIIEDVLNNEKKGITGENIPVILKMTKHPVFVNVGDIIYLRDGMTKGVGIVTELIYD